MNLLFKSKNNATVVTSLLIKELGVKISDLAINGTLEEHPDYPQLKAISDSLDEWHLPNQAYNIKREDYDPLDLYFPFIAHFKEGGGRYILVHDITAKKVCFSDEKHNKAIMTEEEFLNRWSAVALHATITEKSGELNYRENNLKVVFNHFKLPLLVLILLGLILLKVNDQSLSFHYGFLLGLKIVGLGVSVLLLIHSIDANNPLIQNLCNLGNKNNCNAILKSDAAKITSWLSWSEVGFFYFAGSLLALLFIPSSLFVLAWLNVAALPYIIYSLYYQYTHKNWCVLCCTTLAVLGAEFIDNLLAIEVFQFQSLTSSPIIAYLVLAFSLPIITWALLKPVLLKAILTQPLKQQVKKFKYNSALFQQLLKGQPKYGVSNDLMPITLGNPNATTIITMVSNPFCGPCAKAHELVDEWLSYRDDIQVKIIFSTADHDNDEKTKVARHLNALSTLNEVHLVAHALNDWFKLNDKKYASWAQKYPVDGDQQTNEVTAKHKAWCELAEIKVTPTILLNGYKLPAPYRLEDIKYLIN